MTTWRALVLGGGGSTGEFQMGALPVIAPSIDRFDFFAGVGVGALNSSVLAQYPESFAHGLEVLRSLWARIGGQRDILDVPMFGASLATLGALASDKGWARDGVYGNRTLRRLVDEYVAWDRLGSHRNWGIEITSLTDGQIYAITNDPELSDAWNVAPRNFKPTYAPGNGGDDRFLGRLVREFIAAAGSVPFMLPPVDILGHRFVEGGLRDFLPLELAVEAFRLAHARDPSLEAEFLVIDNYTGEIQPETADLLDSGVEIMMRAIKIMTVEMAQNDVIRAREKLDAIQPGAPVRFLRPRVDFRLHPLNFDDHVRRQQSRDEGATVAAMLFPQVANELDQAVAALRQAPDESAAAERVLAAVRGAHRPPAPAAARPVPANIVAPRNLDELETILRKARRDGRRLRALGAGYAFSDVCETDGVAIDVGRYLAHIVPVDADVLADPSRRDRLVEFEAGATIEALNAYLWQRGRTLVNQPGYEKLTFAGVASCGGHGSGLRHGPLSEAIRALHILGFDAKGELVSRRVEPHDGITDPGRWRARYPRIALVQDDERFHAATVAFGAMGIITSVVADTQPSFFLEERRALTSWSDVKQGLDALLVAAGVHSVHVWINPYARDGRHRAVLSEYRPQAGPRHGHRGWGVTFGGVDEMAPILAWFMREDHRAIPGLLDTSLKATVPATAPPMLPCYEALNFGTPNQVAVDPTNVGVPIARAKDAVDGLLEYFAARAAEARPAFMTCPIGLRFTPAARAFLSPQGGRPTCMIELPFLRGTESSFVTIAGAQALLFDRYEGRPHWGQVNQTLTPARMAALYGDRWEAFRRAHAWFDPTHAFGNAMTRQIGLP
jgi:predicted acylesterase/phospholipase RssA